jgi:8-oxo-dGTP diphosphatase
MTDPVDHGRLPYRIAVLCYLYDDDGHVLLLHRSKDPNRGMYSPVGGKLEIATGESPHQCAVREVHEETGLDVDPTDARLTGIVAETAYEGQTHWLIFLFEFMRPIARDAITLGEVENLHIPETDRRIMWPLVQEHRGGFFVVHIDCTAEPMRWVVQESTQPSSTVDHGPSVD